MVINLYDERNYKEVSRGSYHELEFVITYQNIYEPSYYIRWVYPDSTYSDSSLMSFKYFYHNDVMDGPKESFTFGKLRARGFLKENKRHGAQVYINEDGYITKWEYYKDGKKSGVWESCNSEWRMYKKVYYDDNGQFVKQEIYDRRTGKLFRTEYEESRGY
ncbi:MAG TPA: hypothetical protein VGE66_04675 [Chitinophagaceae bacterium]